MEIFKVENELSNIVPHVRGGHTKKKHHHHDEKKEEMPSTDQKSKNKSKKKNHGEKEHVTIEQEDTHDNEKLKKKDKHEKKLHSKTGSDISGDLKEGLEMQDGSEENEYKEMQTPYKVILVPGDNPGIRWVTTFGLLSATLVFFVVWGSAIYYILTPEQSATARVNTPEQRFSLVAERTWNSTIDSTRLTP